MPVIVDLKKIALWIFTISCALAAFVTPIVSSTCR